MSSLLLKIADGEGQSIRGKEHESVQYFSVYDFVNCACAKQAKVPYGKTTFSRLVQDGSEYKDELDTFCVSFKFPGKGQQETPSSAFS